MHLPGVRGPARLLGYECNELQVWECIFTDDMLTEIMIHTNEKLANIRTKYSKDRTELNDVDMVELRALIGLLYYSAFFKSNNEDLEALFSTDGTGRDIFRATLSLKRTLTLLACLRFDDKTNREVRQVNDRSAAISWLFNKLVFNSQKNYSIGEYACIDEMLVGFRGRCSFRMYMGSKPEKYGIKIMILAESKTHYFYNAYIYVGKNSDGVGLSNEERKFAIPTQSVLRLSKPIQNSNRNKTADNWFSSI